MTPYIVMMSVDGRIDSPTAGQPSSGEYYISLERFGKCSKLSERVETLLECPAMKEECGIVASDINGCEGRTAMFDILRKESCNPYKLKLEGVEK